MNIVSSFDEGTAGIGSGQGTTYRRRGACPYDVQTGAVLRAVRERKGVSRRDLAGALGISVQQLSKYETGVNRMTVGFLHHAARLLQVRVWHLLAEPEPPSQPPLTSALDPVTEEAAVLSFVLRNLRSLDEQRSLGALMALLRAPAPAPFAPPEKPAGVPEAGLEAADGPALAPISG